MMANSQDMKDNMETSYWLGSASITPFKDSAIKAMVVDNDDDSLSSSENSQV